MRKHILCIAVLILMLSAGSAVSRALYYAPLVFSAGSYPSSVCAGDLDGDGKVDLAVANRNSDDISIFLGNGDGTFAAAVYYSAGDGPMSICAGDLDSDNDLDLAVANDYDENISILLGNGDGTYTTAVHYGTYDGSTSLCVGDLDGDNDLDLAVTSYGDKASVLLNNGDGTYAPAVSYLTFEWPRRLCMGDLDGDSDLDLAVVNARSNDVSVLINLSDVITGVEFDPRTPRVTRLFTNYPNPFNPVTTMRFSVKNKGRVTIAIYDTAGRRVGTLVDGIYPAGEFEVTWDGTDGQGKAVGSGVYFARMAAGDQAATGKMVIIR